MTPKLSVIIPTKNRHYYCLEAIKQINSLGFEGRIEICIQDNSDDNRLQSQIVELGFNNIIYNYHNGLLSFVDNFSQAIALAHGEYVILIGDDDGVLPNILDVVEIAEKRNIDSIISSCTPTYYWPSTLKLKEDATHGNLLLYKINQTYSVKSPLPELNSLLRDGGLNYISRYIPRLYHGIVKRSKVEEIKSIAGEYFKGLTPDIFIATALCFVCNSVARLDYPMTIAGICPGSGSSDSQTGKHVGRYEDAPHLRGHNDYYWSKLVPKFYSVETIWAETMIQAITAMKHGEMLDQYNIKLIDAVCLNRYPEFQDVIMGHAIEHNVSLTELKREAKRWILLSKARAGISKFKRIIKGIDSREKFNNVEDIHKATELICKIYNY